MALSLAPTAALAVFPPACVCSYAGASCPVTLLRHNIFIPSAKLKGKFNKVGGLGLGGTDLLSAHKFAGAQCLMSPWPEHHHSCLQLLAVVCSRKKTLAAAGCSAICFCCCPCSACPGVCGCHLP